MVCIGYEWKLHSSILTTTNATQYAIRAVHWMRQCCGGVNFIKPVNVVEDPDGDGVEDFYDSDDDGDDSMEEVARIRSADAASRVASRQPVGRGGLQIMENRSLAPGWSIECDGCGYG